MNGQTSCKLAKNQKHFELFPRIMFTKIFFVSQFTLKINRNCFRNISGAKTWSFNISLFGLLNYLPFHVAASFTCLSTMPTRRHAGGSSLIRVPSLHVSSLRMSGAIIIINIIIVPVFICLPGVDTFRLLYFSAPPLLGENMRK